MISPDWISMIWQLNHDEIQLNHHSFMVKSPSKSPYEIPIKSPSKLHRISIESPFSSIFIHFYWFILLIHHIDLSKPPSMAPLFGACFGAFPLPNRHLLLRRLGVAFRDLLPRDNRFNKPMVNITYINQVNMYVYIYIYT